MKVSVKSSNWISRLVFLAMCMPAFALASVPDAAMTRTEIRVSYADLDLASPAGIETLYKRLKAAAGNACGPRSLFQAGSVELVAQNKECYKSALERAVLRLDNAALKERHFG
jgi:UrcA family protein